VSDRDRRPPTYSTHDSLSCTGALWRRPVVISPCRRRLVIRRRWYAPPGDKPRGPTFGRRGTSACPSCPTADRTVVVVAVLLSVSFSTRVGVPFDRHRPEIMRFSWLRAKWEIELINFGTTQLYGITTKLYLFVIISSNLLIMLFLNNLLMKGNNNTIFCWK